MVKLEKLECCGIAEADGINLYRSEKELLVDIGKCRFGSRCSIYPSCIYDCDCRNARKGAFIIFTSTGTRRIGQKTAECIRKNKLGLVHDMGAKRNPNTSTTLRMFIWDVDSRAFRAWYKKNK